MSNSILIDCHFLAFGKFWWLLLAVDELVRGFVWPCFVCYVQIRCCVSGCCCVLVQDRYHIGVAFFYYTIRCFFGGLLWDFLFCFFCYFWVVVDTRFGSAVLPPFLLLMYSFR